MKTNDRVLSYLKLKPCSKSEIAKHSGLPLRTVGYSITEMSRRGIIRPCGFGEKPARGTSPMLWVAQ